MATTSGDEDKKEKRPPSPQGADSLQVGFSRRSYHVGNVTSGNFGDNHGTIHPRPVQAARNSGLSQRPHTYSGYVTNGAPWEPQPYETLRRLEGQQLESSTYDSRYQGPRPYGYQAPYSYSDYEEPQTYYSHSTAPVPGVPRAASVLGVAGAHEQGNSFRATLQGPRTLPNPDVHPQFLEVESFRRLSPATPAYPPLAGGSLPSPRSPEDLVPSEADTTTRPLSFPVHPVSFAGVAPLASPTSKTKEVGDQLSASLHGVQLDLETLVKPFESLPQFGPIVTTLFFLSSFSKPSWLQLGKATEYISSNYDGAFDDADGKGQSYPPSPASMALAQWFESNPDGALNELQTIIQNAYRGVSLPRLHTTFVYNLLDCMEQMAPWASNTTEVYTFLYWPKHLALAVENDSTFTTSTMMSRQHNLVPFEHISRQMLTHDGDLAMDHPELEDMEGLMATMGANIEDAERAIKSKFPDLAYYFSGGHAMVDSSPLQFQCSTANCQDCSADYFAGSLLDLLIIHRKSLSVLANPSMEPSDGDRLVQFQCLARTQQETQQLPQHPDFHPRPQSPYFAVASRRGLLDEITTWAASDPTIDTTSTGDAPSSAQSIYWLYGSVGSGKSYLAREAAESVAREGNNQTATTYILSSGRGTPGWFKESTINISADLRTRSPSTDTLARVQQVSIQMLSNHFDSVIEPWRNQISLPTPDSASGHNLFLVTDIDECEDSDCVLKFVKGALEHVANNPEQRLRILVTGRLDDELQALLESSRSTLVRHLDDAASDAELASYLDSRFRKANDEIMLTSAREDWEWESVRSRLVNRSQGSLIFATTLADFLFEDGGLIYQRLDLLLEIDPNLDTLYTKHLALSQDIPNFIEVVTAIALTHCPLSIPGLANLLGLEFSAVLNVLLPLNSIIHVPGDTKDPVRPFHSALRHFLMDKGRSGRYFAQPSFHGRLARKCMEFLAASKNGSQRESELLLYAQTYCTKHYTQYWNTLPPDAQRNASSTLTYVLHTFPSR